MKRNRSVRARWWQPNAAEFGFTAQSVANPWPACVRRPSPQAAGVQAPVNAADYFQCADCDKAIYRLWLGAELGGGAALCVPCCKARGINPGQARMRD